MDEEKPSKESGKSPSEATRRRRARKWRKRENVLESVPVEQKVESELKLLEEKPVKERVDREGKEQPLTIRQSPVSSSTINQAEAVQQSSSVLESGLLEVREESALTTSKSPPSVLVSDVWETKEVDESPLREARADLMILAIASDVSSEPGPSHQSTNTNSTNEKSKKPSKHNKHKRRALTTENILRVLKGLQWRKLCDYVLGIHSSQREKIEREFASEDQRRTAAVNRANYNSKGID